MGQLLRGTPDFSWFLLLLIIMGFFSHRHTAKWSIVGSSPWLCRNLRRHWLTYRVSLYSLQNCCPGVLFGLSISSSLPIDVSLLFISLVFWSLLPLSLFLSSILLYPFHPHINPPIVYSPSLHSPYSDTMGLNPPGLVIVTYNTVIRLSARIITADGKIARRIRDSMCIMLDYHNMRIPSSPIHMLQAFNARAPCPSLLRSTGLPILEVSQLHGLLWILPSFTYCR